MDDFGVIIYLVGIVAYYIWRAYKKASNPKPKSKAPQPKPPVQREQEREPPLQPLSKPEPRFRPKPKSTVPPKPRFQPEPQPTLEQKPIKELDLDDIFREMFKVEKPAEKVIIEPPIVVEKLQPLEAPKVEEKAHRIKFDESTKLVGKSKARSGKKKFNLKQAIIYQSILQRPYK